MKKTKKTFTPYTPPSAVLSLDAAGAEKFHLETPHFMNCEMPEYIVFDDVLKFVKAQIGDKSFEECCAQNPDELHDVSLNMLTNKDGHRIVPQVNNNSKLVEQFGTESVDIVVGIQIYVRHRHHQLLRHSRSKIILGYSDLLLYNKIQQSKIKADYEIIRYCDDYRIFYNDMKVLQDISYLLQEVLENLNFRMNSQKTKISTSIVTD